MKGVKISSPNIDYHIDLNLGNTVDVLKYLLTATNLSILIERSNGICLAMGLQTIFSDLGNIQHENNGITIQSKIFDYLKILKSYRHSFINSAKIMHDDKGYPKSASIKYATIELLADYKEAVKRRMITSNKEVDNIKFREFFKKDPSKANELIRFMDYDFNNL